MVAPVGRGTAESLCVFTGEASRAGASLPGERGGGEVAPTRTAPVGCAPGVGVVRPVERTAGTGPEPRLEAVVAAVECDDELLATRRTPIEDTAPDAAAPPLGRGWDTAAPVERMALGETAPLREAELGRPEDCPAAALPAARGAAGVLICMFLRRSTKLLPRALGGLSEDVLPLVRGARTRLNMLLREPVLDEPRPLLIGAEQWTSGNGEGGRQRFRELVDLCDKFFDERRYVVVTLQCRMITTDRRLS